MTETLAVEDFPAWESQVSAAGACSHPIRLTGKVQAVNLATGETAEVFKTWTDVPYIDGKGELDTWRDDQSPCMSLAVTAAKRCARRARPSTSGMPASWCARAWLVARASLSRWPRIRACSLP